MPFDELLGHARAWNDRLANEGINPLDEDEVVQRAGAVWKDRATGKLVRAEGQRAFAWIGVDEVRSLAIIKNGADAIAFLALLRGEHGARCKRGETFALNIKAMVDARTMGSWAAAKYRRARDLLLKVGHIERVKSTRWRIAAQYRLTDRPVTKSETGKTSDDGAEGHVKNVNQI